MSRWSTPRVVVLAILAACGESSAPQDDAEHGAEHDAEDCGLHSPSVPSAEAASLNVGRENHSITELADGDVMVVGGNACGNVYERLVSVERYALASQSWQEVAPMAAARSSHAAIALPNGDLLVLGGVGVDGDPLGSVERYVVDEDRWIDVGTLPQPVTHPRALLLASGETIILGSSYPPLWTRSDDDGATWEVLAEASGPSVDADLPLVLLPDGGVLNAAAFSTHVYHPSLDAWTDGPDAQGVAHVSGDDYLLMGSQALQHQEPSGTIQERPVAALWNFVEDSGEAIGFAGCEPTGTAPLVLAMYGSDRDAVVVDVGGLHARWKRGSGWAWLGAPSSIGAAALLRDGSFMVTEGRDGSEQTCTAVSLVPP